MHVIELSLAAVLIVAVEPAALVSISVAFDLPFPNQDCCTKD